MKNYQVSTIWQNIVLLFFLHIDFRLLSDRKSVDKLEATTYEQFKFIQWHEKKYFLINELDSLSSWRDIIAYKWNFIKAVQW